jgi:hypothetical protein
MSLRWFGLLSALVLFTPKLVQAADVAVFAPEISNLSPQDADAVGNLVAQAYAAIAQCTLVAPSQAAPALAQTHDYVAASAQLGVKEYIRLSAVGAGRRVVVTAGRYAADGRSIMQVRQTAESIEDVTLAADSIARALYGGVQGAAPIAQGQPAPMPAPLQVAPKKKNEMLYGIKTGVHLPFAKGAAYYPAISLQFDGRLQLPHLFLEFGAGFLVPTSLEEDNYDYTPCTSPDGTPQDCGERKTNRGHIGGITAELGASYYLTQGSVAPYLGGGIIPRVILAGLDSNDEQHDVASMLLYAQFGLTFPRERSTRFLVDLRIAQSVLPQHLNNGQQVWPTEPSLHAGIGW